MTFSPEQQKIADWLATHQPSGFAKGIGTRERACTMAAINLALTNGQEMTDKCPECVSPAIRAWVVRVQDVMPDSIRNGAEWRALVPLIAGTADGRDEERRAILLKWMWADVLPMLQPISDRYGFGGEWRTMLAQRSANAAYAAAAAANANAANADAAAADTAAAAANAAAYAAANADNAAFAAAYAATAANAAAYADAANAAAYADAYTDAAADAADAAAYAAAYAYAADADAAWRVFDPVSVLRKLVHLRAE